MGRVTVTEDSYIRKLSYSHRKKLMNMLDIGGEWEKLAVTLPKQLDMTADNFEPKYDFDAIMNFKERGRKYDGSPTNCILSDWDTQNATIKHLIQALTSAELFSAADYLSVNVLNGEPVPRPVVVEVSLPRPGNNLNNAANPQNNLPPSSQGDRSYDVMDLPSLPTPNQTNPANRDDSLPKPSTAAKTIPGLSDLLPTDSQHTVVDKQEHSSDAASEGVNEPNDFNCPPSQDMTGTASVAKEMILKDVDYSTLKSITHDFNAEDYDWREKTGGNLLGQGGFGQVFLGTFTTRFQVAIKRLNREVKDVDIKKQFETERHYLSTYRQNNLVQLLGYSVNGPYDCLVYQFMPNGSLEDRLMCKNDTQPLSSTQRINIAKGTAEGIAFLNNNGLVHRDIKSANVLLDAEFVAKLADFATTRTAPQGTNMSRPQFTSCVIGTSAYLAPEAHHRDVSTKLDAFSFGIVLYEILTGLPCLDPTREDQDLKSHMDESENMKDLLDLSAGEWDENAVNVMFNAAVRCAEYYKKKRAFVSDVLEDLRKL